MEGKTASLDLVEMIERTILPRHAAFDKAHNLEHVTRTSIWSIRLQPTTT